MKLSKINTILLTLIILINGYIILAPLLPAALFWWDNRSGERIGQLTAQLHPSARPQPVNSTPAAPQPNHVVIPSMTLDQPIYDGPIRDTYSILDKGIWRWPRGSTPDKGGNTTLIGHRFTYTNPKGVFYYLNKVKIGDEIGLWWNNKEYLYKVATINEVPPTDTAIEDNTPNPQLTIFTCTPLWLPHDRLVVIANLEVEEM